MEHKRTGYKKGSNIDERRRKIKKMKSEMKFYFVLIPFIFITLFLNQSCGDKNSQPKLNVSEIPEVIRAVFSFSYSLIFTSYIFLKVKEFGGRCVYVDEAQNVLINCEFDLRTFSSSGIQADGKCKLNKGSDTEITLSECEIRAKSENFSSEIKGNAKIKGLRVELENTQLMVIVSQKPTLFSIKFPRAQAEIKSLHQGESLRNFEISGNGISEESFDIEVEKIYIQDRGTGEIYILPDGSVKLSGCINSDVLINPFSGAFITFDFQSGCPTGGDIKYNGEQISFGSDGKILYSGEEFECNPKLCPFLAF